MAIKNLKVLAIIPARGGSKGLPKKNIKNLCGKPLIAWSIEQAKKSRYIDKIFVSTDDNEIAEIAKEYGAEVPFLRPIELAGDTSSVTDAVIDAIKKFEGRGEFFDIVVELEPTKCIRESSDIDNRLEFLTDNPRAKSLVSLIPIESPAHPDWAASINEEGFIKGYRGELFRRQNLSKRYCYSGFVLISYVSELKKEGSFYTEKTLGFPIKEKEKTMDINDGIDFVVTEAVMKEFLKKNKPEENSERNLLELILKLKDKKIILFGAASSGKRVLLNIMEKGIKKENISFYDNNPEKWGKKILGVQVLSLDEFRKSPLDIPILISSCMFNEITEQLKKMEFTNFYYIRDLLYAKRFLLKYDENFIRLLEEVEEKCNMDSEEKFTLYSSMKAVFNLKGEIAEVGVYKGGSAKILAELKGEKELHLFDTFEGLPEEVITNEDLVKPGWLNDVNLEEVKSYLSQYNNVFFHKGLFPDTAEPIKEKRFSLVHLDTDIYQGTLESLKFFWPRMVKGGRIICHDYNNEDCPGVKKAFKEFFYGKEHLIIDIADTQGMVIKDE